MKKSILFSLMFALAGYSQSINFSRYDSFLKKNVSSKGTLDFERQLKNYEEIKGIVSDFGKISPTSGWTDNEIKSYWINLYNANLIKLVTEYYPLKTINYIIDPFKQEFINLNGIFISLDYIQKEILKEYKDPRIHFVLYAACNSSPQLKSSVINAQNLDQELNDLTKAFINDTSKNSFNAETNTVKLSSIFEWYKKEFVGDNEIHLFINKYSDKFQIDANTKIEYIDYDWLLPR